MPAGCELDDLGVDRLHPALAGDRDSVVAVDDEVGVAQLVDRDRRKAAFGERALDVPPAQADLGPAWKEVAVEVAAPAVRADDLRDGDRLQPEVPAGERLESPSRLVEREKVARPAPPQQRAEPPVG